MVIPSVGQRDVSTNRSTQECPNGVFCDEDSGTTLATYPVKRCMLQFQHYSSPLRNRNKEQNNKKPTGRNNHDTKTENTAAGFGQGNFQSTAPITSMIRVTPSSSKSSTHPLMVSKYETNVDAPRQSPQSRTRHRVSMFVVVVRRVTSGAESVSRGKKWRQA